MNQIGSMFLVGMMGILGGILCRRSLEKSNTGNPCIIREKVREGCLKRAAFLWYETPLAH